MQTLLKARKIRIISGRVCIVETILHFKPSPLRVCIYVLHSSPFYTTLSNMYFSYLQLPTYNFWKIKNKFQSMQLCKYKYLHTKTVFQEKLIWRFENYNESKYKINPRRRKTFIPCLFKVLKSDQFQNSSCCFFLPRKGI